jgi:hypothetical protein
MSLYLPFSQSGGQLLFHLTSKRADSDLDILVEFGEDAGLFEYAALQLELSDALGMQVEVANKAALKPRIGQRILAEVRMV